MRAISIALLMLATACGGGGGGGGSTGSNNGGGTPPPVVGTLESLSVTSSYTGMTYPITVYLPSGYATSTGPKTVLYSMDHELEFNPVRAEVEAQRYDAIIVSIGNIDSARRFIDFDLPGAEQYYRFLTLELLPRIESQYRVDASRRVLLGYSLSGLMAIIAMLDEDPASRIYKGYVITDPSLQFHTAALFGAEQHIWDTNRSMPITVHHCSSSNADLFTGLPRLMIARGYTGLDYRFQVYNLDHGAILVPCIRDGLAYFFRG